MYKLFAVALCALVLIGAGCQKKQVETAAQQPVAGAAAEAAGTQIPTVDPNAPVDENMISQRLRDLAPQYSYAYSAENTSITGPGTPPEGVKLPVLIGEAKAMLPSDLATAKVSMLDQVIDVIYKGMKDKAGAAAPATDGARPEPIVPKAITGSWRSVREEQGAVKVQHDDKYYEQMSITKEGRIGVNTIRDGQLFAQTEFGYRYDTKTGKMVLLSDAGAEQGVLYFTTYPDHPELIYVKEEGNDTAKVYENIGGSGATAAGSDNGGLSPVQPKNPTK